MIVKAIIDHLKASSSIDRVYPESGFNVNMGAGVDPYVLVGERSFFGGNELNGATYVAISVHYPIDYEADLTNFIMYELRTLLDRKVLTIVNGSYSTTTRVELLGQASSLARGADGFIFRERLAVVPCRWR